MTLPELKEALSKIDLSKWDNTHLDCGTFLNAQKFVETSISYLEANKGNQEYLPYYSRLLQFYQKTKE